MQAKSCHPSVKSDPQTLSHRVSMSSRSPEAPQTPSIHPGKNHREDNRQVPQTCQIIFWPHTQKFDWNNLKQMSLLVPSRFWRLWDLTTTYLTLFSDWNVEKNAFLFFFGFIWFSSFEWSCYWTELVGNWTKEYILPVCEEKETSVERWVRIPVK